jgi:elongation factor P--beta-lysine ligase
VWTVTRAIANWYDAVELWVTQLAFPFQVVLAVLVVLPLCFGVALLLDRLAGALTGR